MLDVCTDSASLHGRAVREKVELLASSLLPGFEGKGLAFYYRYSPVVLENVELEF